MNDLWLPEGNHWGLRISHERRPDSGPFIPAEPKLIWHTTQGTGFEGARETLIGRGDEPHALVSVDARKVLQFIPFNRTSKSLQHPLGTLETNHAHCVQIEVCGFAQDSHNWTDAKMRNLAALAALIEHRTNIERATHVSWANPRRVAPAHFIIVGGHLGHMHAPNQPDGHSDPGRMRIHDLFEFMAEAEAKFQ